MFLPVYDFAWLHACVWFYSEDFILCVSLTDLNMDRGSHYIKKISLTFCDVESRWNGSYFQWKWFFCVLVFQGKSRSDEEFHIFRWYDRVGIKRLPQRYVYQFTQPMRFHTVLKLCCCNNTVYRKYYYMLLIYTVSQKKLCKLFSVRTSSNLPRF